MVIQWENVVMPSIKQLAKRCNIELEKQNSLGIEKKLKAITDFKQSVLGIKSLLWI